MSEDKKVWRFFGVPIIVIPVAKYRKQYAALSPRERLYVSDAIWGIRSSNETLDAWPEITDYSTYVSEQHKKWKQKQNYVVSEVASRVREQAKNLISALPSNEKRSAIRKIIDDTESHLQMQKKLAASEKMVIPANFIFGNCSNKYVQSLRELYDPPIISQCEQWLQGVARRSKTPVEMHWRAIRQALEKIKNQQSKGM